MTPADITVVIPTLNEEIAIARSVRSALCAGATDIIVSDGGSQDRTFEVAAGSGASKVVRSLPGRGIQMNSGAQFAEQDFILFLHADNELSEGNLQQICDHENASWGAFRQRIDSPRQMFRLIEWGNAWRVRWRRMPFGDQAIFVRSSLFRKLGGFAEIPLMEDVELSQRLRKLAKPTLLNGPLTISARRWEKQGILRQTMKNWSIQVSYLLGVSPESLARRYYGN